MTINERLLWLEKAVRRLQSRTTVTGALPTIVSAIELKGTIGSGSLSAVNQVHYVECPFAGTIVAARIIGVDADGVSVSGSAVVDVWKRPFANFPPTVTQTITASAKPTLSGAIKAEDTTLTGWTTAVAEGDWFAFKLESLTTCAAVLVQLTVLRS